MSFLVFDKIQSPEVLAEGPADAKIVIVGEAPGATEERLCRPFVGASGSELDKLLHSAGLLRQMIYLTNVIKERPKNNEIRYFIDLSKKYPVVTDSAKHHLQNLKYELECHPCNVIVALGNTALWALTEKVGITKWRGSILESTLIPGKKVIPTYHPRHVLPPTGVYTDRNVIIHDLLKAKEQQKYPEIRVSDLTIHTAPSFSEVMDFLLCAYNSRVVDVDIEVWRYEVSCIGFTTDDKTAICIPFVDEYGDYWNIEQEAEIWRSIAMILEESKIKKRGQNFLFDSYFLLRKHGIRTTNIDDTMVAQGICYPDYPKGLDFITSMYTDIPYYKDEGKKWNKIKDGWPQMWAYNAKDVLSTAQAWPALEHELKLQRNEATYARQVSLIEPLSFMQHRGVLMDIAGISRAKETVSHAIENLREKFYKECGREINPNSPAQLKEYFYSKETGLGLVPYINRKTHQPSVDSDALKRIARKGYESAKILLELRRLTKLHGTYLEITLDADSRLRCSFNPVGTSSGRLSSSKTIFDTGTNLQNQPYEMRQFMLFDERYIGYNIDLSQAENRLVAYVGNVYEMIEAFETGLDVHKLTASLIFNKPIDQIIHDERQWGKKANHGLNYDLGYKSFALIYEIEEKFAKYIVDKYHQAYPGVRQSYHQQVKDMLSRNRTVTNCLGRNRVYLDRWGDTLFKEAFSFIPQSTVADIMNERGIEYIYYSNDPDIKPVELLLQVHDSIVIQIPRSLPLEQHAIALMKIKKELETPISWRSRTFSIPADIQVSFKHMGKGDGGLIELPKGTCNSQESLLRELQSLYSKN